MKKKFSLKMMMHKARQASKSGEIEDLKPRCQALLDAGLSAKIN